MEYKYIINLYFFFSIFLNRNLFQGFTLVEIIVVLVILAILAAVAIPSVLGYVDEAKKAGIIQEAHWIYEAAQIAATKCYATDEDEFKKQSIFKYNYTLPADFPYKKTTTNPVGRVSDSLMSYGQKEPDKYLSDSYSGASYIDKEIVKNVLHFLQSENKNSAIYKYKVQTDCLNGQSLNDYKPSKFNGFAINIFYNQQGKIEAINFARDNYMVTIYNGKLNSVKGGKSIKSIEKK